MLYELSRSVTKYNELQGVSSTAHFVWFISKSLNNYAYSKFARHYLQRFQNSRDGRVEKFDLRDLIEDILEDVDKSNHEKIEAVKVSTLMVFL